MRENEPHALNGGESIFEFEDCDECGRGDEGHERIMVLGNPFYRCIKESPASVEALRLLLDYPYWTETFDPDSTLPAFTTLDESEVTNALDALKG